MSRFTLRKAKLFRLLFGCVRILAILSLSVLRVLQPTPQMARTVAQATVGDWAAPAAALVAQGGQHLFGSTESALAANCPFNPVQNGAFNGGANWSTSGGWNISSSAGNINDGANGDTLSQGISGVTPNSQIFVDLSWGNGGGGNNGNATTLDVRYGGTTYLTLVTANYPSSAAGSISANNGASVTPGGSLPLGGAIGYTITLPAGIPSSGGLDFVMTVTGGGDPLGAGDDIGIDNVSVLSSPPCPNSAPVANTDFVSTQANTPLANINVQGNDSDPDGDPLTVVAVGAASHGTVSLVGGIVSYTPALNYNGPDSFTYTITDGQGHNTSATVFITVLNTPPVAVTDTAVVVKNQTVTIPVLTNDTDPDGDPLTVTSVAASPSTHGTLVLNPSGTVTYTPTPNYVGPASFTYTVSDGRGGSTIGTVNITAQQDTDGDGIPDLIDLDDDNDGIPDTVELATARNGGDTDSDGIPDSLDLDSDNDGIPDLYEGGLSAATIAALDANGDGVLDGGFGPNGLADAVETAPEAGTINYLIADTDGDGHPDFQDLDSDNDGLNDVLEANLNDTNGDGLVDGPDTDGDGINDIVDGNVGFGAANVGPPPDTDGDGVGDWRDLDSDNDSIDDVVEGGSAAFDTDGDGIIDGVDTDGDGIRDLADGAPNAFGDANDVLPIDTDKDGVPDYQDLDSDNDAIDDIVEAGNSSLDTDNNGLVDGLDTDQDGILDLADNAPATFGDGANSPPPDTDGDTRPDFQDLDSDNDNVNDIVEGGNSALDTNQDGIVDGNDSDGDGIRDLADGAPALFGDAASPAPPDTDADGTPDYKDLDSDGDGITDFTESGGNPALDANNDGVIDNATDTDIDGIAQVVDGGPTNFGDVPDHDNDGIPDAIDLDDDNDGIPDLVEQATATNGGDTDGDGIPDSLDLDSDNDGIPDLYEGGLSDSAIAALDTNGDGEIDPSQSFGANGLADAVETAPESGTITYSIADTDSDGRPDFQDLDSDNDGINDLVEAGYDPALVDLDGNGVVDGPDNDHDGMPDLADGNDNGPGGENALLPDTDSDGVRDWRDLDSDNDGVNDVVEGGNAAFDTNGDGLVDGPDSDGDGISDAVDGAPAAFGDANAVAAPDTDADGVADYRDLDSDNDGSNDVVESGNASLDTNGDGIIDGPDSDGDGIIDAVDGTPAAFGDANTPALVDTDSDGVPDMRDLDSDNDGIDDVIEDGNGARDANHDGLVDGPDIDGDGIQDAVDGTPLVFGDANTPALVDTDGDGVPDIHDLDSDNDGIDDVIEGGNSAHDTNHDGLIDGTDSDGDGIFDAVDGTPVVFGDASTTAVPDTDGDAVPDYRDLDSDNDGINDVIEGGNATLDANHDGIVDGTDTDGDGILDTVDGAPALFADANDPAAPNTDGDAVPDYRDLDSDNDGIDDVIEGGNGALDANHDGLVDGPDTDGDGILTAVDGAPTVYGDANDLTPPNTDGDAVPDYQDLDSDNDGIDDVIEGGNGSTDANHDGLVDGPDTDGDGILTAVDGAPTVYGDANDLTPPNTDGDTVPDYRDLDSDNDGINDVVEGGNAAFDTNNDGLVDGTDTDKDGIRNTVDGAPTVFGDAADPTPPDTDSDGKPNYKDLDSDGDGLLDVVEGGNGGTDANKDGVVDGTDTDGDGIIDVVDGAPATFGDAASPAPLDLNANGIPDYLEVPVPSAITLTHFTATRTTSGVVVQWTTSAEIDTWGFHLLRSTDGTRASAVRVTATLIPAQGRGQGGASYTWTDTSVPTGVTASYWLEETEVTGTTHVYGPATADASAVNASYRLFIPLIRH